ncbi:hypothetical protein [Pseudonocardia sp.]|uniref:hypothetical protein n=1 Tax=Pseudonocardia sp. TaxID=60912 RepID=UPI003D0D26F0
MSVDGPGAAEQRLADALRARAVSGGYAPPMTAPPVVMPVAPVRPAAATARTMRRQIVVGLAVALAAGVALGVVLALISLFAPGLLPIVG